MSKTTKVATSLIAMLLAACGGSGDSTTSTNQATQTNQTNQTTQAGTGTDSSGNSTAPTSPGTSNSPAPETTADSGATPTGTSYNQTVRFTYPSQIARDSAGNLYVQDTLDLNSPKVDVIRKIGANGEVTTLPRLANTAGIMDLAACSENLFALSVSTDAPESRPGGTSSTAGWRDIIKISPDGTRTTFASYRIYPGSYDPVGISADAQCRIYVDTRYRIISNVGRIAPDGTRTGVFSFLTWGSMFGMKSDAQGNLAIGYSDPSIGKQLIAYLPQSAQPAPPRPDATGAVSFPDAPGLVFREVSSGLGPMSFDAAGNLYILTTSVAEKAPPSGADTLGTYNLAAITVRRMAPDGTLATVFSGLPQGVTTQFSASSASYGSDIVAAPSGDVYITLPYDHTIYKIDSAGRATLVAGKNGEAGTAD